MKKLSIKFSNHPFLLIAFLILIVTSCTEDDDGNNDPENTNPNAKLAVINVDIMANIDPVFGDEVYLGDNGILSTTSGIFWNPCQNYESFKFFYEGFSDEFGKQTTVDLLMNADGVTNLINISGNELQDSGITDANGNGFELHGLLANEEYDLSIYIYGYNEFSHRTTFDLTHAAGKISAQPNGENTFQLPGEENKDYILIEKVNPYEISKGVYGFKIDNIHNPLNTETTGGAIMGFQLKGLVTYQN